MLYFSAETDQWSSDEIEKYQQALWKCDKDFFAISKEVEKYFEVPDMYTCKLYKWFKSKTFQYDNEKVYMYNVGFVELPTIHWYFEPLDILNSKIMKIACSYENIWWLNYRLEPKPPKSVFISTTCGKKFVPMNTKG